MNRTRTWALAAASCLGLPYVALAGPPGVKISEERSPDPLTALIGKPKYVGSPSIVVLPNGHYVASHDVFTRNGGQPGSVGITKVFRSTDCGRTWRRVARIRGAFWSSMFVHRRKLWMIGVHKKQGDLVLRRSTDGGSTWTRPVNANRGLLRPGPGVGGAPHRPVVHNGRVWAVVGLTAISAPARSNLLRASSWTRTRPASRTNRATWLNGRFEGWFEAQIVASPTEGVVLLPHLKKIPYTAIQRVTTPTGRLAFDPAHDFIRLPGGSKKFGATYDPVSGKFWALTNPILDRHRRRNTPPGSRKPPKTNLIRNTAAIYTSVDLRRWTLDRIFLYDPDVHRVGFQYLDFTFDGRDMIVVARTAYKDSFWYPPRQHDSNLLTFHRVRNVRVPPADPLPRSLWSPRAKIDGRGL